VSPEVGELLHSTIAQLETQIKKAARKVLVQLAGKKV